jgi:hypothetical protein
MLRLRRLGRRLGRRLLRLRRLVVKHPPSLFYFFKTIT